MCEDGVSLHFLSAKKLSQKPETYATDVFTCMHTECNGPNLRSFWPKKGGVRSLEGTKRYEAFKEIGRTWDSKTANV